MAKKSKKGKKSKGSQEIVGSPLTPVILEELKVIENFKDWNKEFKPKEEWESTYLFWLTHGYRMIKNDEPGSLRIKRTNSKSNRSFSLKITEKIAHEEGAVHITEARIRCLNDPLASPVEWKLSGRFIGPDKKERPELEMKGEGSIKGDSVKIKSNKYSSTWKKSRGLTGDWCLFEAIQRMPFKKGTRYEFDVLEGMSLLKEEHTLSYRGVDPMKNNKKISLQRFQQIGHGVLPYEYWLDKNHRLVIAVTGPRAYILDDNAEEKFEKFTKSGHKKFRRLQARYRGRE